MNRHFSLRALLLGVLLAGSLALPSPASPQRAASPSRIRAGDSALARCLADRIQSSGLKPPFDISLSEQRGVVTVNGSLSTLRDRQAVASLLEAQPCVRFVHHGMSIRTSPVPSDEALQSSVLRALGRALPEEGGEYSAPVSADLDVESGRVSLSGIVASSADRARVGDRIRSVPGVRELNNRMRVVPEPGMRALEVELLELLKTRSLPEEGLTLTIEGEVVRINGELHDVLAKSEGEDLTVVDGPSGSGRQLTRFVHYVLRDRGPTAPEQVNSTVPAKKEAPCPCSWRR